MISNIVSSDNKVVSIINNGEYEKRAYKNGKPFVIGVQVKRGLVERKKLPLKVFINVDFVDKYLYIPIIIYDHPLMCMYKTLHKPLKFDKCNKFHSISLGSYSKDVNIYI